MRRKPGHAERFQFVAITRSDTQQLAIPGGMVDDGEHVSETLRREFSEEAANSNGTEDIIDRIFATKGGLVYEGYVDDPRNTDNAWVETTARLFFVDEPLASQITLTSGTDAESVRWVDVDDTLLEEDSSNDVLYADHKRFLRMALAMVRGDR